MFALLDELAPRRRQLQHAQGVACRRRIEEDVVVITGDGRVGEEVGELIKSGDFYGTRAGQLFLHVAQSRFRQKDTIRPMTLSLYSAGGLDRVPGWPRSKLGTGRQMAVALFVSSMEKTSCRFDAGSVLMSRTCFPASARATAVAQATDVLPTPPLPVRKRYFSGRRERDHKESLAVTSAAARRASGSAAHRHNNRKKLHFPPVHRCSSRKAFLRRYRRNSSFPQQAGCFEDGRVEADEAGKFIIRRIAAGKLDGAVDEDEGRSSGPWCWRNP